MRSQAKQTDNPQENVEADALMQVRSHLAASQQTEVSNPELAEKQTEQRDSDADSLLVPENASSLATSNLTTLLQTEARLRKRDTMLVLVPQTLFGAAAVLVSLFADRNASQYTEHLLGFFLLTTLLMLAMIAYLAKRAHRRKHILIRELAQTHDIDMVGPLIDATRVENTQTRNLTKRALTKLLPQLRASDGGGLTNEHRNRLLHFLTISPKDWGYRDLTELFSRSAYRREVDLRIAILKGYEQVGGAKEMPIVERLSKGLPNWQSASRVPQEIRRAAQECLPALQLRAGEQRASEQLLRASSGSAVPADVLLRPVENHVEIAPEHLLRASENT